MPGTDFLRRTEEAAAFEQALDQALGLPEIREALQRTPDAPRPGQLRRRAHRERATLCATAAAEYETYARLRAQAESHTPAGSPPDTLPPASRAATDPSDSGGLLPALAVLVPSLGAVAAVLFLAIGFGMRLVSAHRQFADELVYAGWLAAGVAAAATVADLVWLLATAARNRPTPPTNAHPAPTPETDLAQARAAWHQALLERGILPFLLTHLQPQAPHPPTSPTPTRPGYSAPEYGRPEYGRPDYASPGYDSPGYDSPEHSTAKSPH
ncbi:hypothetical protein ACH4FX_06175 [Streptomyces sp. NPDC018019]|uniref:hypothetical protein n=1 Tax=Streptomyces sp. NPDC018019 TaxID=3365030 RepID=UPI0037A94BCD